MVRVERHAPKQITTIICIAIGLLKTKCLARLHGLHVSGRWCAGRLLGFLRGLDALHGLHGCWHGEMGDGIAKC